MDQVVDKMIVLSDKKNLLDVGITDIGYLRELTFNFLRDADWPRANETDDDAIYDTIYDLGYKLMDIWFKPVMNIVKSNMDRHGDFDLDVQEILQSYFLEEIQQTSP